MGTVPLSTAKAAHPPELECFQRPRAGRSVFYDLKLARAEMPAEELQIESYAAA